MLIREKALEKLAGGKSISLRRRQAHVLKTIPVRPTLGLSVKIWNRGRGARRRPWWGSRRPSGATAWHPKNRRPETYWRGLSA